MILVRLAQIFDFQLDNPRIVNHGHGVQFLLFLAVLLILRNSDFGKMDVDWMQGE